MDTMQVTRTEVVDDLAVAALAVVESRKAADAAKMVLSEAEATFMQLAAERRVEKVETPEAVVTHVTGLRRKPDTAEFARRLSAEQFAEVTEPKVVLAKLDAALELGVVRPEQVDGAVAETPYEAARVTWRKVGG